MGLQEQIIDDFFSTLEEVEGFPPETLQRLKELFSEQLPNSKEQILDAVERGIPHAQQGEIS
jgi:hypothetical protein